MSNYQLYDFAHLHPQGRQPDDPQDGRPGENFFYVKIKDAQADASDLGASATIDHYV